MTVTSTANPLLSICIPAYNRPEWLERAIASILTTSLTEQAQIEIIISDDSTIPECGQISHKLLSDWNGPWKYQANSPSLGMAPNWNRCIQMASGQYVLVLHDDDYLVPNATVQILEALQDHPQTSAFLFGVNVVTSKQELRKQQHFQKNQYLDRKLALQQVLLNSSFVRFPGIVLRHDVFDQVGYFDPTVGGIADIHLWVRIFNAYGVLCMPITTANYTVHADALTMDMFNAQVIQNLLALFGWVKSQQWLDLATISYCKTNYFHQFILAGSVRYIRLGDFKNAEKILNLFDEININPQTAHLRWKAIRIILTGIFRAKTLFDLRLPT